MYIPRPAKLLFQHGDGWSRYLDKHGDALSDWTKLAVERMLACGTRAMLLWARQQGIEVGIFCALHTYGRQLNQHPHIHVSVTRGGLDVKHGVWRHLFFKKKEVEAIWRNAVVYLLRDNYAQINPGALPGLGHIRNEDRWHRYLHAQYRRSWKVHFAKKTRCAWRSVKCLGRYLKRPPVAASQLRHYRGGAVIHRYYDHRTQQHKRQKISQEEMLQRYVSHIPARHFKMVRYYGFLANRKRGTLLPKVYDALEMTVREKPKRPGFAVLMKGFLGTDPYQCILCKGRLRFAGAVAGDNATKLLSDRLHRMEKSDGFRSRHWISAHEKQVLD